VDPVTDTAILAVKALFSAYSGYTKGKFTDSDRGVREEVRRRSTMLKNHLANIHTSAHDSRHRKARREADNVIEVCEQIQTDAQFSTSRTPHSTHDGIGKMNKKSIKKLIDHDLSTLQKLVKCANKVNEISDSQAKGVEEIEVVTGLKELAQMCTGTRNHFLERNMLIDGLTKR
tara:strand:- start:1476 stop:1997 length:522 start_codon:yes stop_codon:yes gene_type:complete